MIVYYGRYSNTCGEEFLIGYEEGNCNTDNVIIKKIDKEEEGE